MPERSPTRTLRCAIYTRKSSEEGLEQDFNSLKAQREACEAYILSQKHEGWTLLRTAYDDGAYSGGTMERPALQQLLADIAGGHVDVVVVYKVDRLTRALTDFAKIVEVFDQNSVSFVSVTQQFNTTTSMGRLTLNVLLSFAQFEREVTGERIRDKIAASKKKGLWMGGFVPLGYRANGRTLVIDEPEAQIVRRVFELYRRLGSVLKLEAELRRQSIHRPASTTMASKRVYGSRPFMRGELYKLLGNPVYVGEIHHKGHYYEGQHPPVVDRALWDAVRACLASNTHDRRIGSNSKDPSLLAALLYDEHDHRLTPTHTVKKGKRYRYYSLQHRRHTSKQQSSPSKLKTLTPKWRVPAAEIETVAVTQLAKHLADPHWMLKQLDRNSSITQQKASIAHSRDLAGRLQSLSGADLRALLLGLVHRVILKRDKIVIDIVRSHLIGAPSPDTEKRADYRVGVDSPDHSPGSSAPTSTKAKGLIHIEVPIALGNRGVETKLIVQAPDNDRPRKPDPVLVKLIANAHRWWQDLSTGRHPTTDNLAKAYGKDPRYVARVIQLAFLPPPIVEAIVAGTQPTELTAQSLMTRTSARNYLLF